jgi:hypothetical protein
VVIQEQRKPLEELIAGLPPEAQEQLRRFAEFLLKKYARRSVRKLCMDWAGALMDLKDRYILVELQHKILGWRTEDTLAELCDTDGAASEGSSTQ